jgi:NitT/TauT family transport system permease protein
MLLKRFFQFLLVYFLGLASLLLVKYILHLSDYVIPGTKDIYLTTVQVFGRYLIQVLDTLTIAILGHALSIIMATAVGIIGRLTSWIGSFIKVAAYNIQSYPIVAIAPIIFILIGAGLISRLLIAALICYFPLLLSIIGILTAPVTDIEHFYRATHRMTWWLEVKIRAFQNMGKLTTVISGSATLALAGTIVAEFIAGNNGIGYSIRIALYQSNLSKILIALFMIGMCTSLYQAALEWTGNRIQQKCRAS